MNFFISLISLTLFLQITVFAAEGNFPLDKAPNRSNDINALQNGAKLFVNYCLNCHSASLMRYNRLKDIGLTDNQIRDNLLFTSDKVGDLMNVNLSEKDAKTWFGAVPPDLSVIARAKSSSQGSGSDWLYTYLRTYYLDETRDTGWNNLVYPNVGMPHVLWELQGTRKVKYLEKNDPYDKSKKLLVFDGFEQITSGKLSNVEYDSEIGDLVAFLDYMSEPVKNKRQRIGVWVLLFMGVLVFLTWRLNASYWKEVK
tara:strand:+ start:569 stop:1333 length:765 start_codon:yes stop_codon:yes gene_type:complete